MCGIGAILHLNPKGSPLSPHPIDSGWIDALDHAIAYRGPDGHGRFTDQRTTPAGDTASIALVHRRLSILDHSGGAQPMTRGGITVVFNGCIYNHRVLRAQLESLGHHFTTDHSDTEVLLHGWKQWHHDLWLKLDGMFAIILWDAAACELVAARDRFGEKPLFAAQATTPTGTYAILASTTSAVESVLSSDTFVGSRLSPSEPWNSIGSAVAIAQGAPQHEFPCRGITSLSPGTVWSSSASKSPTHAMAFHRGWWWSGAPRANPSRRLDSDNAESEVENALVKAVSSRLESDVPLGALLSGGVDSSLVCALAKRELGSLTTVCIRMPHAAYDESEHAQVVAKHLSTNHHTIDVSPDPLNDLEHLIRLLGLPFGDSSLLPTYWACRAASKHAKVLLSGDGGDELFLGYERYKAIPWLQAIGPFGSLARLALRWRFSDHDPKSRDAKIARFLDAAAGDGYLDLTAIFPKRDRLQLIPGQIGKWAFTERCRGMEYGWDIGDHFPDVLLAKVDHASLAAGVELRAPLLSNDLATLVLAQKRSILTPGNQRKGLLRAIAKKYLPADIVDRPKMGFAIPLGDWFRTDFGGLRTTLSDVLASSDPFPASQVGCELNLPFARQLLAEHLANTRDHSQRLYMLLVLAIWCRQNRSAPSPRYAPAAS